MLKNTLGTSYTSPQEIDQILSLSARLRYMLSEQYHLQSAEIISIHIDGANHKLDIDTESRTISFKVKGTRNVLLTDPEREQLIMSLDPALAQGLYEIIEEFGQSRDQYGS